MSIQAISRGSGATIKGINKVVKGLKQADKKVDKAFNTAVKVEGFRLKNLLQKEIKQGNPGGQVFSPLSYIARRWQTAQKVGRKSPNRNPLASLATAIRYQIGQNPFKMSIGFVGDTSKKWKALAKIHQEGFKRSITTKQRLAVVAKGASLGTIDGGSTPFFLRKTTKFFETPARPIINPFWQVNEIKANANIKSNFKKKLKGIKI